GAAVGVPELEADVGAGLAGSLVVEHAAVVGAVGADTVDDEAVGQMTQAERLAVERIARHGSEVVRDEGVERIGPALLGESIALRGQGNGRAADGGASAV